MTLTSRAGRLKRDNNLRTDVNREKMARLPGVFGGSGFDHRGELFAADGRRIGRPAGFGPTPGRLCPE
jgi:hypothetical protein